MPTFLTRSGQPQWIGTEPFTREQRNAAGQAIEDRLLVAGIGLRVARPAPSFERQEYHATDTGELFRTREISGAPGTFEWRHMNPVQDISGLVPKSLVDAKGDLLAGSADDTLVRRSVGTNRHVLMPDSTQASGLRYGTDPLLGGYSEVYVTPVATSGTVTLDLAAGNVFTITPSGAVAIAFTGTGGSGQVRPFTVRFANSAHAVTWPAGTRFADAIVPTLSGVTFVSGLVQPDGSIEVLATISGVATP